MLTEKIISMIQTVLDSDLTAYRIAKEVGYASANPIHKMRNGESDIMKMQLATIVQFEKIYEEMDKMKTNWKLEKYYVQLEEFDYDLKKLGFYTNDDDELLGYVYPASIEDIESMVSDLNKGVDPIEYRWEDGYGNTLDIDGWGDELEEKDWEMIEDWPYEISNLNNIWYCVEGVNMVKVTYENGRVGYAVNTESFNEIVKINKPVDHCISVLSEYWLEDEGSERPTEKVKVFADYDDALEFMNSEYPRISIEEYFEEHNEN